LEEIISEHQEGAGKSEETPVIGKAEPGSPEITEEHITGSVLLCKGTNLSGKRCRLRALADGYCFAHSPALENKRKEARLKGGSNSARAVRIQKLLPSRLGPVNEMLGNILKELYEHKMDARTAQAIASVSRALVTVLTAGELEERIKVLEEKKEDPLNVAARSD
jgi:hypothetical protein